MNLFVQVIINSASDRFWEFQRRLKPYLDVFGMPYRVVDRQFEKIDENCEDTPLLVLAHNDIQCNGRFPFSAAERRMLRQMAASGIGVVSFDPDSMPVLGFGQVDDSFDLQPADRLIFSASSHYITELHEADETKAMGTEHHPSASIRVSAASFVEGVEVLLYAGSLPYLACLLKGASRIVQWMGSDWMDRENYGPLRGLDDLLWRSFVWAARKPFIMREIPPFATLRVDANTALSRGSVFSMRPYRNRR